MQTCNIIGAGHVGQTLAYAFTQQGWTLQGICNRHTATQAAAWIGQGSPLPMSALPPADLWLLGVQDDQIVPTAQTLANTGLVQPGNILAHFSGALPSAALAPLPGKHISLHPCMTFPAPLRTLEGLTLGWEGDPHAFEVLAPALEGMGLDCLAVPSESKPFYHAMAVFMGNYQYALLSLAQQCAKQCGWTEAQMRQALAPLATTSLHKALEQGPSALTGPVARGDTATVLQHCQSLCQHNPALAKAYKLLAQELLPYSANPTELSTILDA